MSMVSNFLGRPIRAIAWGPLPRLSECFQRGKLKLMPRYPHVTAELHCKLADGEMMGWKADINDDHMDVEIRMRFPKAAVKAITRPDKKMAKRKARKK